MSRRFVDSFRAGPGLLLVILYRWLSGMQERIINKYQFWSCSKAVYKPVWHKLVILYRWLYGMQEHMLLHIRKWINKYQSWSCSKAVYKPVWHIPLLSVQWMNSWWWTEELSETCRVSCQNKFVKSVHLVGFIIKKFVMMHGHMNIKYTATVGNTTYTALTLNNLFNLVFLCYRWHQVKCSG